MTEVYRRLPVGIQSFEKIRKNNFVYVDKTEYIYRLGRDYVQFFLSRPRRFGKSLFLSSLRAYWEGRKDLFSGLAIEKLEENNEEAWQPHPVFYFDFNGEDYDTTSVETVLDAHLKQWEKQYDITSDSLTLGGRFKNLLTEAARKTGRKCVVLVDEYDKPLLDLADNPEMQKRSKSVFKGFFSNLKNCDDYVGFVFITGVTKFHKVSIFSDLNHLKDISLNEEFSSICGMTEDEIRQYFAPEVKMLSENQHIDEEECMRELKKQYDGYRFHQDGADIYNPYSILNAFYDKEFGAYWFESGTPSFLLKQVRNNNFDVRRFSDRTIYANERILRDYTGESPDLVPLLYQSGYLTITEYDAARKRYTLGFPNNEVRYAFLESLMPEYVPSATAGNRLDIFTVDEYIENGETEKIMDVLTALFAGISYTSADAVFEHYFQSVIYILFTLLGQFTDCEVHTFNGRIDCRVLTRDYIYLFEFKRDDSADNALKQINDKGYTLPFAADRRKLIKIGVSFDSEKRILSEWKAEE
ncbi:MAG: ATP-binding protein [Oscillospiraceae bacterium]|nr:ATP-binding protein [Oscillospiraceae bacterium]